MEIRILILYGKYVKHTRERNVTYAMSGLYCQVVSVHIKFSKNSNLCNNLCAVLNPC